LLVQIHGRIVLKIRPQLLFYIDPNLLIHLSFCHFTEIPAVSRVAMLIVQRHKIFRDISPPSAEPKSKPRKKSDAELVV
jgi:hypothetical protein